MRTYTRWVAAVAVGFCMAGQAVGDLVILRNDGSTAPSSHASKSYNPETGGWDIQLKSLYAPGGVTSYTIRADGGEIIDNLWIDVPCWENDEGECIPAGSPVFVRLYSDAPNGLRTIHNIEQTGTAETLLMHAETTHDIGAVTVQTIDTLHAGRDIVGPITATTPDNPARGIKHVIADRDVRGDIVTTRGRILTVNAGRHIGSAFSPAELLSAYGQIEIDADDDVHAEVTAGYDGASGYLASFHCRRFFGSITTPRLGGATHSGRMQISDEFEGSLIIGGSLADYIDYIVLPSNGITGQIVINADNEPNGTWNVPIHLGPLDDPDTVVLEGPLHDAAGDQLGEGSIGMAPFHLHEQSCSPANGSTVTLQPGQPSPTLVLQHYGPITWPYGSPVTIERRALGSEAPFQSVSTSQFTMYRSSVNPARLFIEPQPGQPGLEPGYLYRIRPTFELRCDLDNQPPVQWLDDYLITVELESVCPGDLNSDTAVNTSDLLVLLASWGPVGDGAPGDLNGNGMVDVSDMLLLLGNWGNCPQQTSAPDRSTEKADRSRTSRRGQ